MFSRWYNPIIFNTFLAHQGKPSPSPEEGWFLGITFPIDHVVNDTPSTCNINSLFPISESVWGSAIKIVRSADVEKMRADDVTLRWVCLQGCRKLPQLHPICHSQSITFSQILWLNTVFTSLYYHKNLHLSTEPASKCCKFFFSYFALQISTPPTLAFTIDFLFLFCIVPVHAWQA